MKALVSTVTDPIMVQGGINLHQFGDIESELSPGIVLIQLIRLDILDWHRPC
jgi:hypothetical protein